MKFYIRISIVITLSIFINCSFGQVFSSLSGDYLGQNLPGNTPVIFAPGIVSMDTTIEHGSPTFSTDGNEVFWQSNYLQKGKETKIYTITMKRIGKYWTKPQISDFGGGPIFSIDGNKLFYKSKEKKGFINFVERHGENWSHPQSVDLITRFPRYKFAHNISITKNGTLYFIGFAEEIGSMNNFGIYRSKIINGKYSEPELLPSSINMGNGILNWTPFIAPDESYLLFSSNRKSPETDYGDIYISFRNNDDSWSTPVNLGNKVNTNRQERFPAISPDGKYLFFTRWIANGNDDVFWVKADIINELKNKQLDNTELQELFKSDQEDRENHLSSKDINYNDSIREARVYELLDSNKVVTAEDYNTAALIFHHGEDSVAYAMAVKLMKKSIELDSTRNKWFLAAITDRYLLSINKPQIYGTQYKRLEGRKVIQENMDTTQISDAVRIEYGVETLAEQKMKLINLNRKKLTDILEEGKTIDELVLIIKKEDRKTTKYDLRETWLNNFGYQLMNEEKNEDALKIFELNTWLHPRAYNTFDSYGECLLKLGYKDKAIEAYKKSLELNQKNYNAVNVLSRLKQ